MMCDCRSFWPTMSTLPGSSYYQQHQQPIYHQMQPQVDLRAAYYYDCNYTASSSRQMRNQAEKQRRDKLNQFINELALLVPMVSTSAKKLDKTSILRLSATFLRMHQILIGVQKEETMKDLSIPMDWCKTVLDGMEGMLLVVTSTGKIVFMTDNVEKILGHHQNDLLGQSLFNITHLEDHDELKKNLKPCDEEDIIQIDGQDARRPERRSFFLKLKQRAASRSDQPQYEMVHVEGHLRIPSTHQQQSKSKTHAFERYLKAHLSVSNGSYTDAKGGECGANSNDVVLVALVRPYKEKRITDNSLLEATKEEWLTRHLLDGTIVFADHRISILSGYMSEEVSGNSAFKYMHKDDAHWVKIALRQMFCQNSSYGWSCYRLQSKNGEFIYLRTQGYLEVDESQPDAKSFICVNTLVSAEEGENLIIEMKQIFTPLVKKKPEPLALPDPVIENVQNGQGGAKLSNLQGKYNRPSVITSITGSTERLKRSQDNTEEAEVKRLRSENRSVIVSDITSVIKRHDPETYELDTNSFFNTDLLLSSGTSTVITDDESLRLPEDVNSSELWENTVSDLEDKVLRGHLHLEDRIHSQGVQIQEIEEDLQTVPISGSHVYRNHITHLKAEQRKQQEMLKTLQHEHQNIQQVKDQLSVRGAEQDIGA